MLNVDEALQRVLAGHKGQAAVVPTGEALGLVLAEDVTSDVDSPPHDKALVDGYAVRAADVVDGRAELTVLEEVTAGAVPTRAVTPGHATRIMTGAPLPEGADSVVMVEQTDVVDRPTDKPRVRLEMPKSPAGRTSCAALRRWRGATWCCAALRIRAIELGVLAEVGVRRRSVIARPSLAVLSTGNELVPSSVEPGPGQIRNSNGPLLVAAAKAGRRSGPRLGHCRRRCRRAATGDRSAGWSMTCCLSPAECRPACSTWCPACWPNLASSRCFTK